jgi:hypothetical protein
MVHWQKEGGEIMLEIMLTDEQAKLVAQANGPVPVRDANGAVLGHIEPKLTPD